MYSKHLQHATSAFIEQFTSDIYTRFWSYFNLAIIFNALVFSISFIPLFIIDNYFDGYNFERGILNALSNPVSIASQWIGVFMWNSQFLIAAFITCSYTRSIESAAPFNKNFLFGKQSFLFMAALTVNLVVQFLIFNGDTFGITAWVSSEHSPLRFYFVTVLSEILRLTFGITLALLFFRFLSREKADRKEYKKFLFSGALLLFLTAIFFWFCRDFIDFVVLGFLNLSDRTALIILLYRILINVVAYIVIIVAGCCAIHSAAAEVEK